MCRQCLQQDTASKFKGGGVTPLTDPIPPRCDTVTTTVPALRRGNLEGGVDIARGRQLATPPRMKLIRANERNCSPLC